MDHSSSPSPVLDTACPSSATTAELNQMSEPPALVPEVVPELAPEAPELDPAEASDGASAPPDAPSSLAEAVCPHSLAQYHGQSHLLSPTGTITNFLNLQYLPSMILYGPPGVGKTTLARILAEHAGYVFVELSATDGTIQDLRELLDLIGQENASRTQRNEALLAVAVFIDEIHRFRTNQQDYLLPLVESGHFVFIGATTYDPRKRLRKAIVSRCQLFELKPLLAVELHGVLKKAILTENVRRRRRWNRNFVVYHQLALDLLVERAKGDTRKLINYVEMISLASEGEYRGVYEPVEVGEEEVEEYLGVGGGEVGELYRRLFDSILARLALAPLAPEGAGELGQELEPEEMELEPALEPEPAHKGKGNGHEQAHDHFFSSDLPRSILKTDTPAHHQYAAQMEFSDDEYGPTDFLSDSELDYLPVPPSDKLRFQVVTAIETVLQLLNHHESPLNIVKKLFMFSLVYTTDNSQLTKFLGLLRTLTSVKVNHLKLLSLLVERLVKVRKSGTLLAKVKLARGFFKHLEPVEPEKDPEVCFDEELVAQLLTAPAPMEQEGQEIAISSLDFDDEEINIGIPPADAIGAHLLTDIIGEQLEDKGEVDEGEVDELEVIVVDEGEELVENNSDSDLTPMLSYPLHQEYDSGVVMWPTDR